MRGLLLKDLALLKNNSKTFAVFILVAAMLMFTGGEEQMIGALSYFTIMCGMLSVSTITYDEFDKSTAFLMTLPVNRDTYAKEKFVFAFLFSLAGWAVSVVLIVIIQMVMGKQLDWVEMAASAAAVFLVLYLMTALMIPLQIKFGADNSRIVILGFIVIVFGAVFLLKTLGEKMNLNLDGMGRAAVDGIKDFAGNVSIPLAIAAALAVEALVIAVSYVISRNIMRKKEF